MSYPVNAIPLGSFGFTLRDALGPAECEALIELASDRLAQSGVVGTQLENYRTSAGAWLESAELPHILGKLRALVEEITELPVANQESVQVLHYEVGQEYKYHHDFWEPSAEYYEEQMSRGGQRSWSVLVYLNDVPKGGGTAFPELEVEVLPERGKLLAWKNVTEDGLNYESLHAGLMVEEGVKWVAVFWIREKLFT